MRFRQYLDQHSTPEWKRAYIDYRACTRQIAIISARLNGKAMPDEDDELSDDRYDVGPARPRKRPIEPRPGASGSGLRRRTVGGSTPRLSLPASVVSFTNWLGPGASGDRLPDAGSGSTRTAAKEAGQLRSATTGGGAGDAPPSAAGSKPVFQEPWQQSSLSTVSGSENGVEEIRDDDREKDKDGDGDSFMGTGTVLNRYPLPKDSIPRDEDDIFSPSLSSKPSGAPPPDMTPPHLASVPSAPEAAHTGPKGSVSRKWSLTPAVQKLAQHIPRRKDTALSHPDTKIYAIPQVQGSVASLDTKPSPGPRTLEELYDCLEPDEYAFFKLLDKELHKVEGFFAQREANCKLKYTELREQIQHLLRDKDKHEKRSAAWDKKMDTFVEATTQMLGIEYTPEQQRVQVGEHGEMVLKDQLRPKHEDEKGNGAGGDNQEQTCTQRPGVLGRIDHDVEDFLYPDKYVENRRTMRKALSEFYHHLELLKNYRIVNLTGFQKSLRMFEKVTNIGGCVKLYTDERIAPCRIAHCTSIDKLLKNTEDLYAQHFTAGDIKAARRNLRTGEKPDTYYYSTYRGAFMVGLAIPAVVLGIIKFFDDDLRKNVPAYEALMVVYSAFFLPVIFVLLFQLNLDAWVKMRINYEFVMEISRPCLDHRCFHEIPAFLFLTLSYCFCFSFYRVAPNSVAPTTWPIAWLVFVCIFFLNPFPVCRSKSRWWFVRALGHVITPGLSSVKFVVFFIADILNSHTYTIQNIYLLGCASANNWPANAFQVCKSSDWAFALLGSLAPLARLLQCVKRYWDTRLPIHLLNAAKYSVSITNTCLQVWNRSRGFTHDTRSFVPWVIMATLNSVYACTWDFVVDWSLLRPGYKCLRPDLGYPSKWMYYVAMVFNVLVRFVWVWSLPNLDKVPRLRGWIFALMEVIRRWVWNFFRVETEHLGNADSYRAHRDIPLPYRKGTGLEDDDKEDEQARAAARKGPIRKRLDKLGDKLVGTEAGRGPDALNVGARGRAGQREYEAQRPGDSLSDQDDVDGDV